MSTSQRSINAIRPYSVWLASAVLAIVGFCQVAQAVSVRFVPLNDEIAGRKIGVKDSKGITLLKDLNAKKRSKGYACEIGKTPLALVALDRERPNDKPASVEVVIPADTKSPLVLIFPNPDDPSGIRAIAIDDSSAGFPWGSLRFVNTTENPIMIRYDKETKIVPASRAIVDIAPGGTARNMGVQLSPETQADEVLYSAVWEHDPNLRKLIFIVPAADPAVKELTLDIIPQDKRAN